MVEHRYSKDKILQMYLNKVYFGHGAYGIQSAAQTYFGKDVNQLTPSEAAFLAGLVRAPHIYSREDQAVDRRNLVLDNMVNMVLLTPPRPPPPKKNRLIFASARHIKARHINTRILSIT